MQISDKDVITCGSISTALVERRGSRGLLDLPQLVHDAPYVFTYPRLGAVIESVPDILKRGSFHLLHEQSTMLSAIFQIKCRQLQFWDWNGGLILDERQSCCFISCDSPPFLGNDSRADFCDYCPALSRQGHGIVALIVRAVKISICRRGCVLKNAPE